MAKNKTTSYPVDPKKVEEVQEIFYKRAGLTELINNNVTSETVMSMYFEENREFMEKSEAILREVAPHIDIVKNPPEWNLDFEQNIMYVTEK